VCRRRAKEFLNFHQPRTFDVAAEFTPQIFGLRQSPLLFVSLGFDDSEKQRLNFAQVAVTNGEVNAKTIPGLAVPVFSSGGRAGCGDFDAKADVVKLCCARSIGHKRRGGIERIA